jgi:hypothetical protein
MLFGTRPSELNLSSNRPRRGANESLEEFLVARSKSTRNRDSELGWAISHSRN